MKFDYVPNFEHICGVKIAESMWNHNIFLLKTINHSLPFELKLTRLNEVENQVCRDISSMAIKDVYCPPLNDEEVKPLMIGYIKPLGIQFLLWKDYEYNKWSLDLPLPNTISWNSRGILDRKKITIALINAEKLDIVIRFKLATIYCLEDSICELWPNMTDDQRNEFSRELGSGSYLNKYEIAFWKYCLNGKLKTLLRLAHIPNTPICNYQTGFLTASSDGNMLSTEYFFNNMPLDKQQEILENRALEIASLRFDGDIYLRNFLKNRNVYCSEILCFLFSKMNESQKTRVLKDGAFTILGCVLDWPWQRFFIELLQRIWGSMTEREFRDLLWCMQLKHCEGYCDYDYMKLFKDFWTGCPNALKNKFIDELASWDNRTLENLLHHSNDSLKYYTVIFKDIPVLLREKIIFSPVGKKVCLLLSCEEKWFVLNYFLSDCLWTTDIVAKFKTQLKRFLENTYPLEIAQQHKEKLDKLFSELDKLHDEVQSQEPIILTD